MNHWIQIIVSMLSLALAADHARALEIEFRYLADFESQWPKAVAGFERAAAQWEAKLSDPVVVRIEIAAEPFDIDQDTEAATDAVPQPASYAEIRAALVADATSADDHLATAHLPPGPHLTFRTRTPVGAAILSSGTQPIHEALAPTRALSKALGLPVSGDSQSADGQITWNQFLFDPEYFAPYDYDPTDGVVGLDFVGTAMHEIGHILGFYSGATEVDLTTLPAGPWAPLDIDEYAILKPLDLFRYSAASLPYVDVAPGGAPYFSIDGGATSLALFHTGAFNGDGLQADHWRGQIGVMGGSGPSFGRVKPLTALDLRSMDVIGWNLRAAPEPSAFTLVALAMTPFVGRLRNRRRHAMP